MSVNSSLFGKSLADPNVSDPYSSISFRMDCLTSKPSSIIYTTIIIFRTCVHLPLSIFILRFGLHKWKQNRSTSSAAPMSHSDFFSYLAAIIELVNTLGHILCFVGIYVGNSNSIFSSGIILNSLVWYGEIYVNVLASVDRYLAVVHPITYLKYRNKNGIKVRNITCCCLWLSSFIGIGLLMFGGSEVLYASCLLTLALITVSFCSLSVLCTLIQPGPGKQGKNKERIDPSKQRPFYTIVAILVVLLIRFVYGIVRLVIYSNANDEHCLIIVSASLFNTPSSLVLPLLFLHRTDKLMCF